MVRTKYSGREKRKRDSSDEDGDSSEDRRAATSAAAAAAEAAGGRRSCRSSSRRDEEDNDAAAAAGSAAGSGGTCEEGLVSLFVDMLKLNMFKPLFGRGKGTKENPNELDDPTNGDNSDDDEDDDGTSDSDMEVDVEKARMCLEAAAGDLDLAAHFFMEDYHATAQHLQRTKSNKRRTASGGKAKRQRGSSEDDNHDDDDDDEDEDDEGDKKPASKNDETGREKEEEENDDDGEDGMLESNSSRRPSRARNSLTHRRSSATSQRHPHRRSNDDGDDPGADDDDDAMNDQAAAAADDADDALISDDDAAHGDGAGRRRRRSRNGNNDSLLRNRNLCADLSGEKRPRQMTAAAKERMKHIKEAAEAIALELQSKKVDESKNISSSMIEESKLQRRKEEQAKKEKEDEEDDDPNDFISDEDWLGEETGTTMVNHAIMWSKNDPAETSDDDDDNEEDSCCGIPKTWLAVGFRLSDCTTGLTVNPPDIDAIETMAWKLNRDPELRTKWPEPYHCKSVTSILSIVTALLYTGASIQGDDVKCTTGRTPWAELSPEDRKREFEGRLADALSSLIFIAAKTSLRRKTKACQKVQQANKKKGKDVTDDDIMRERRMQTRLQLIPVCVWNEQFEVPTEPRGPGEALYEDVLVKTSLTNINHIRQYVLSTMRAFTAPGGVALLIETVRRIHGSGVVGRNLARARSQHIKGIGTTSTTSDSDWDTSACLIRCTCDKRLKIIKKDKPLPTSVRNDPIKLLDMTPPGTECVSVELLTLLLTGDIQTSFHKCDAGGLGFGLLTDRIGDVGPAMSRPEKPVWVLRGPTCFSVLCIKNIAGNDDVDFRTISKVDSPGATLDLLDWNVWYTGRNKTELRVVSASQQWVPPSTVSKLSMWDKQNADAPLFAKNARRTELINNISIQQERKIVAKEKEQEISREELERVKFHPEDERLYPGKYRMWRYDFGQDDENAHSTEYEGKETRQPHASLSSWKHFFRLSSREKRIVELKMGPKINAIILTRWPDAKIRIVSEDEGLPIA